MMDSRKNNPYGLARLKASASATFVFQTSRAEKAAIQAATNDRPPSRAPQIWKTRWAPEAEETGASPAI